jgi:hypothetical protein
VEAAPKGVDASCKIPAAGRRKKQALAGTIFVKEIPAHWIVSKYKHADVGRTCGSTKSHPD